MTNGRVAPYNTSVQIFYSLAMCTSVYTPSGIWRITTLYFLSTNTTVRIVIAVYIDTAISIDISIRIAIAFAIEITIAVDIEI